MSIECKVLAEPGRNVRHTREYEVLPELVLYQMSYPLKLTYTMDFHPKKDDSDSSYTASMDIAVNN